MNCIIIKCCLKSNQGRNQEFRNAEAKMLPNTPNS